MITRKNIDEDVHLIMKQNDVTHESEKDLQKGECMDFIISIRNPTTTFFFLEGQYLPWQLGKEKKRRKKEREKGLIGKRGPCR